MFEYFDHIRSRVALGRGRARFLLGHPTFYRSPSSNPIASRQKLRGLSARDEVTQKDISVMHYATRTPTNGSGGAHAQHQDTNWGGAHLIASEYTMD